MKTIQNWLLPILILVSGLLVDNFDLIEKAVVLFNFNPSIIGYAKFAGLIIGAFVLKLEPPSKSNLKALAKTNPEA